MIIVTTATGAEITTTGGITTGRHQERGDRGGGTGAGSGSRGEEKEEEEEDERKRVEETQRPNE